GGVLGQVVQVRLRALQPALAGQAAGADRDLRLDDVPAGAQRIRLRVQEGEDAVLLVRLEHPEPRRRRGRREARERGPEPPPRQRSEEHTSELQSRENLVCRLLLVKKKNIKSTTTFSA